LAGKPDPKALEIGELRWPVAIAKREQAAAGTSTISESLTNIVQVHASIKSLGPLTFLAGEQTDRPVTHRIYIRWLDWLDLRYVIVRQTIRLDQSVRLEVFRLRKIGEVDGRKRFLEILAELESRE
jgi:head-tail adaptor